MEQQAQPEGGVTDEVSTDADRMCSSGSTDACRTKPQTENVGVENLSKENDKVSILDDTSANSVLQEPQSNDVTHGDNMNVGKGDKLPDRESTCQENHSQQKDTAVQESPLKDGEVETATIIPNELTDPQKTGSLSDTEGQNQDDSGKCELDQQLTDQEKRKPDTTEEPAMEESRKSVNTNLSPPKETAKEDDEDDDIIVVSQTPKDQNKKPAFTSMYKCVRCGHISPSRAELNKHLLQSHKLIIVSKQKSVDCLFCNKKLDMADLHKHLRSVHKVLLVKSTDKNAGSNDTEKVQSSKAVSTAVPTNQSKPSEEVIDITGNDEKDNTVKLSLKKNRENVKAPDGCTEKSKTARVGGNQTSKGIEMQISNAQEGRKPPEYNQSLVLRRTPRKVTARKYTEYTNSSSDDDGDDDDLCVIDDNEDDEDYSPTLSKKQSTTTSKRNKGGSSINGTPTRQNNARPHEKIGPLLIPREVKLQSKQGHDVIASLKSPAVPKTSAGNSITSASQPQSQTTPSSTVPVVNSTPPAAPAPVASHQPSTSSSKQLVHVNGQLYQMAEKNGTKFLIPLSGGRPLATPIQPRVTTPAMPSANVMPLRPTQKTVLAPIIAPQGKTTQTTVRPQATCPTPGVSPQLLQSSSVVVHVPSPAPMPANVPSSGNVLVQSNSGQLLSIPKSVLLQSSTLQPGQTLLLTIPPGAVSCANTSGVVQGTQLLLGPGFPQGNQGTLQRPILRMTTSATTQPSTTSSVASMASVQKPVKLAPTTVPTSTEQGSTASKISTASKMSTTRKVPQLPDTPSNATSNFRKGSRKLENTPKESPVKLQVSKATPAPTVTIARPKEVYLPNAHKTDGLFALEVCLDTAAFPGRVTKEEKKVAVVVQEKVTVFEEPPKKKDLAVNKKKPVDAELSKIVVAAAAARSNLVPNDLAKLSDEVFFECARCNACFPQHLQLALHMKHCSKLAPSTTLTTKIYAPLAVLESFYEPCEQNNFYVTCRICQSRIIRTSHGHVVRQFHLAKHIQPKVELNILPETEEGMSEGRKCKPCTDKALEWVDYIVPPFTMENAPTSAKEGSLYTYVTTESHTSSHLVKKKKKKKKHRHSRSDSDDDDDCLRKALRLASLRSSSSSATCYYGSLRPKDNTALIHGSSGHGAAGSMSNAGNRLRGGRTMMRSFKTLQSPNKVKSTLTACIPVKAKYKSRCKQGESTRRWNNGKTRSQLRSHWRRPSRRFADVDNCAVSTHKASEDVIQLSSDEDDVVDNAVDGPNNVCDQEMGNQGVPSKSGSPVTLTEDDISDYLQIIDEADDMQTNGSKSVISTSPEAKQAQKDSSSDLLDYYGNDVDSTLTCEPLIMEPEQVLCYFKKSSSTKMMCQLRNCETEVNRTIRAMLAHIRVHFQILVPLQMLASCGSRLPRQSIPRPLRLTFSQVQAHFTLADTQEANLHLGEVQQVYTCMWGNCARSKCYKKTICSHLIKHIFFTLISKEDYQSISKTMSAYSPADDNLVRKLRIVAINKLGHKVCKVISVPSSQTHSSQTLKVAIKKALDTGSEPLKLPANVLSNIAAKFAATQEESRDCSSHANTEKQTMVEEAESVLTQADIDKLREKFPSLVTKWKIATTQEPQESGEETLVDKGEMTFDWMPKICNVRSLRTLTESESEGKASSQQSIIGRKSTKTEMPKWRSLIRRKVPSWNICVNSHKGALAVKRRVSHDPHNDNASPKDTDVTASKKRRLTHEVQENRGDVSNGQGADGENTNQISVESSNEAATLPATTCDSDSLGTIIGAVEEGQGSDQSHGKIASNNPSSGTKHSSDSGGGVIDTEAMSTLMKEPGKTSESCGTPQQSKSEAVSMLCDQEHVSSRAAKFHHRKRLLFGLSSSEIVKFFRLRKPKRDKQIRVKGRGFGLCIFRCRIRNCRYFQEAMTMDRKVDIVRALACHLQDKHVKGKNKPMVFYSSTKSPAVPRKEFLKLFKDASTHQDFNKVKIGDKFCHVPFPKTRLCALGGRRVRLRGRFYKCLASGCSFGCAGTNRQVMVNHLRAHLSQAAPQEENKTQDCNLSVSESKEGQNDPVKGEVLTATPSHRDAESTPVEDQDALALKDAAHGGTGCLPSQYQEEPAPTHADTGAQQCHAQDADPLSETIEEGETTKTEEESAGENHHEIIPMDIEHLSSRPHSCEIESSLPDAMDTIDNLPEGQEEPVASVDDASSAYASGNGTHSRVGMSDEYIEPECVEDNAPGLDGEELLDIPEGKDCSEGNIATGEVHTATENEVMHDCDNKMAQLNALPVPESLGEEHTATENEVLHDCDNKMAQLNALPVPESLGEEHTATENEVMPACDNKTAQLNALPEPESVGEVHTASENEVMRDCDETAQLNAAPVPNSAVNSDTSSLKSMDKLLDHQGDTINMFFDDLESYFMSYTTDLPQGKCFGLKCYKCPKCGKADLRGANLTEHLQSHIGKEVRVSFVDSISISDPPPLDSLVKQAALQQREESTAEMCKPDLESGGSPLHPESSGHNLPEQCTSNGPHDDGDDGSVLYVTENDIIDKYFTKGLSTTSGSQKPYQLEFFLCRKCSYRTITIMDVPEHIEQHVKRKVCLKK